MQRKQDSKKMNGPSSTESDGRYNRLCKDAKSRLKTKSFAQVERCKETRSQRATERVRGFAAGLATERACAVHAAGGTRARACVRVW